MSIAGLDAISKKDDPPVKSAGAEVVKEAKEKRKPTKKKKGKTKTITLRVTEDQKKIIDKYALNIHREGGVQMSSGTALRMAIYMMEKSPPNSEQIKEFVAVMKEEDGRSKSV